MQCLRCHRQLGWDDIECRVCGGPAVAIQDLVARYDPVDGAAAPAVPFAPGWVRKVSGLATGLAVLLAVEIALDAVLSLAHLSQLRLLLRLQRGELVDAATARAADDRVRLLAEARWVVYLALALLVVVWLRWAYRNAIRLGSRLPHSPGWAIGSWFVPVISLFRPKQMVDQAWQASDPALPPQNPLAWSIVRRSRLVTAWWTAFLLDGLVRWIAALHPTDHALSSLRSTVEVRMVSDVVELVAAFLFLNVVLSLTARQTARIAALGA